MNSSRTTCGIRQVVIFEAILFVKYIEKYNSLHRHKNNMHSTDIDRYIESNLIIFVGSLNFNLNLTHYFSCILTN